MGLVQRYIIIKYVVCDSAIKLIIISHIKKMCYLHINSKVNVNEIKFV